MKVQSLEWLELVDRWEVIESLIDQGKTAEANRLVFEALDAAKPKPVTDA
jgi:hypothetical protein